MDKINQVDIQVPCMFCKVAYRDVVILPCNHEVTCQKCSQRLNQCPYCRTPLREIKSRLKNAEDAEKFFTLVNKDAPTNGKEPTVTHNANQTTTTKIAPPSKEIKTSQFSEEDHRKAKLEEVFHVRIMSISEVLTLDSITT